MEFYTVEEIKNDTIRSSGLPISVMSSFYKALGKTKEFQTLESVSSYQVVYLAEGQFVKSPSHAEISPLPFVTTIKKEQLALVPNNTPFELIHGKDVFYGQIHYGKLVIADSYQLLKQLCVAPNLDKYSEDEKKAFAWLESGKTGLSSLTMCKHIFPNIRHHYLDKLNENEPAYPRDSDDLSRCLFFLSSVPEAQNKLQSMKEVSVKWSNLIDNWDTLVLLFDNKEYKEVYSLIQKCTQEQNKLKM